MSRPATFKSWYRLMLPLVGALLLAASTTCSNKGDDDDDNDDGSGDPKAQACSDACNQLNQCGWCVDCGDGCLSVQDCTSSCIAEPDGLTRANCIKNAPQCDQFAYEECLAGVCG